MSSISIDLEEPDHRGVGRLAHCDGARGDVGDDGHALDGVLWGGGSIGGIDEVGRDAEDDGERQEPEWRPVRLDGAAEPLPSPHRRAIGPRFLSAHRTPSDRPASAPRLGSRITPCARWTEGHARKKASWGVDPAPPLDSGAGLLEFRAEP